MSLMREMTFLVLSNFFKFSYLCRITNVQIERTWRSDNFERYLFSKKIVLENEVSHMDVEPNTVVNIVTGFLQFVRVSETSLVQKCNLMCIRVNNFWLSIFPLLWFEFKAWSAYYRLLV